MGYYLTSLGEMPCGWSLCTYKTTEQKQTEGLFVLKAPSIDRPIFVHSNKRQNFSSIRLMLSNSLKRFQITEMSGGYLIDSVIQQFNRTFENGVHPTIRCIALDLGGVYLNGDIDTFYNYLKEKFSIVINKRNSVPIIKAMPVIAPFMGRSNHQFTGGHGCRPITVRTDGLRQ